MVGVGLGVVVGVGLGVGVGVDLGVDLGVGVGIRVRVGVRVRVGIGVGVVHPGAEDPPDGHVGDGAHKRALDSSLWVESAVVDVRSMHGHSCVW